MAALIVLVASLLIYRGAGALGLAWLNPWESAARCALSTMLLFTATAHFTRMRDDLVRMMPPSFPWPRALVYFTGLCEIAGAIGLLFPVTRRAAGLALIAFFVAVFPANVRAARSGGTLRGKPATPLLIRAPMQLLFIFLAWWVSR
jgi:uncharacterized membrane protein